MSDNNVLISVLNWNNFESTEKCVLSVLNLKYSGFQILIIDNKSTDSSYEKLKKRFPSLKVIQSEANRGYASGHKIGVEYALNKKFKFIWVLNNDLIVRENSLSELLNAFRIYGLGVFGSITLKSENPDIINFGGGRISNIYDSLDYNKFEGYTLKEYNAEVGLREVQSIEGSSFIVPAEVIEKYGFLREDFFMYGEETDYCFRLNKQGIKSYVVPSSIVVHKGAESLKDKKYLEKYYRRRNFLYFEKSHYGISIIKNISRKVGIINSFKYFLSYYIQLKTKDDLYYQNLANVHALLNKKGKLND
jgi:GT2 family glycosyltransferase